MSATESIWEKEGSLVVGSRTQRPMLTVGPTAPFSPDSVARNMLSGASGRDISTAYG